MVVRFILCTLLFVTGCQTLTVEAWHQKNCVEKNLDPSKHITLYSHCKNIEDQYAL